MIIGVDVAGSMVPQGIQLIKLNCPVEAGGVREWPEVFEGHPGIVAATSADRLPEQASVTLPPLGG